MSPAGRSTLFFLVGLVLGALVTHLLLRFRRWRRSQRKTPDLYSR